MIWIGVLAGGLAVAYGAVWSLRPESYLRSGIKTGSTAILALGAVGQPLLMAALVFGAAGDWFLSRPKGFLAGLVSFALGHGLYLLLFWRFAHAPPLWGVALVAAMAVALVAALWSGLGALRGPVVGYAALSVALAAVAMGLPPGLAMAGVLSFVASDMVLAVALFGLAPAHPAQPVLARVLWALYWGGQAMILFGSKSLISGIDGAGGIG